LREREREREKYLECLGFFFGFWKLQYVVFLDIKKEKKKKKREKSPHTPLKLSIVNVNPKL
jgi:hypothetical protein